MSAVRIPRGFSEEVRQQADIVRIVSDYLTLRKKGANYWGCCPFHQEKTPSFTVSASKQFFKCFGCGKAGDVFTFVMELEGASFPEAVETIAGKIGLAIPVTEKADLYEALDRKRAELFQLNQWALEFFEESLLHDAEGRRAQDYLVQRGVLDATRKTFRLGYAPNRWDALGSHLQAKGASRAQIETSGLVSLKEGAAGFYDRFRGRLIFPIQDPQGRVVAFGGRLLGEGEPKYLNSPETAVYTKGHHLFGLSYARDAIRRRGFVILVEGYLDFLIPYQAGIQNLVASLGTALTDHQVRLLGRYVRQIVVNFDPDSAGVAATKRSLEVLLANGFKVNVLSLPDNLDPDEFIRKHGAEGYWQALKTSHRFLDYIVEQAIRARDPRSPAGKVETINEILPYVKLVRDRIERADYVERIADRLKVDSQLIRDEFRTAVEARQEKVSDRVRHALVALKPAEKTLLQSMLASPSVRHRLLATLREEDYLHLRTARLFQILIDFDRAEREPTWPALNEALADPDLAQNLLPYLLVEEQSMWDEQADRMERKDDEDLEGARSAAAAHTGQSQSLDDDRAERQAWESLLSIRCDRLADLQASLQMEINQAQRNNDEATLQRLAMRRAALARQEWEMRKLPLPNERASVN
ncbi:MAG: DNA primase [Blastocatellia bacterium]